MIFKGKRVVITGGSSGIGYQLAKCFLQEGASVIILARHKERLDQAVATLKSFGNVSAYDLDVSKETVKETLASILEKGKTDILVNNAGLAFCDYIENTPNEQFDYLMRVNYFGVLNCTQAVLPEFKKQGGGTIVNVTSLAGAIGTTGYAAYTPSKFAAAGLTEVLRSELKSHNIRVIHVLPSDVDTPQFEAENRTKPAETIAISGSIKPYKASFVAREIIRGIACGKVTIVPGFANKAVYMLYRIFPGMARMIMDFSAKKASTRNAIKS